MKQFIIKGAFFTDIITNSSSVVYSWANSSESFHGVIDTILELAGSDKKSKDIFDIFVVDDSVLSGNIDDILEMHFEEDDEGGDRFLKAVWGFSLGEYNSLNWKGKQKLIEDHELNLEEAVKWEFIKGDYYRETNFVVRTKEGVDTELGEKVYDLFSHEGSYDG